MYDVNGGGLATRSHSEYREGDDLTEMIEKDLVAERVAIESYREMIAWLEGRDPTTRRMLESILAVEEQHADELRSMLQDVTAHLGARAGSRPKGVAGR